MRNVSRMKPWFWGAGIAAFTLVSAVLAQGQDRRSKVLGDRDRVESSGFWIYNDLPRGFSEAKKTGKPLLVTFRCIPCEHCAKLDEQVVERDPGIQKLLSQFVCVRVVHANAMDLSLFQFDYDQSWTAFFLNADRIVYGRYGTRSHQTESAEDMSLEGFSKALQAALDLHRQYPKNKALLTAKTGAPAVVKVPEEFPSLRGKYTAKLDYTGKVVQSCIHCHQVREAERMVFRTAGKPMPDTVLFPYPHPKTLGLIIDPATKSTLKGVASASPAEKDGFKAGDEIATAEGQPVLSIADIQWVLHHAGPSGAVRTEVRRGGKLLPLKLTLAPGWRQRGDISWRATSWDLRRMVTGGLLLAEASAEERRQANFPEDRLALKVMHVGEYGEHAVAKQAGFQKGDLLTAVNGRSERMSEGGLMASLLNSTKPGDRASVSVLRGGQKLDLTLKMQ